MGSSYAIVTALYLPHTGGVENFTSSLSKELAREGNSVTVITSRLSEGVPEDEIQADGIRIVRLPSYILLGGRLPLVKKNADYRRQFSMLAHADFDRVLINTRFYPLSIEGLRLAKMVGAEAIVLDHGSAYLTLGNPAIDAVIRGYEHAITKMAVSFHPRFAGISKKSCEWLKTFGIKTSTVIPNAIDALSFRESSSGRDFRSDLAIPDGCNLVSFIGRLAPEKGAEELADAARLLGDGFVFLFAGEGSLRGVIERKNLSNIVLLGNISREDVSALLSQSDIFCLPTRSEGFCTALLEAAAWTVPCVVTDVGGVAEIFGDDPRGAIILGGRTSEEIAMGIRRATEAGRVVRGDAEYSWTRTVRALERAYNDVR